MNKRFLETKRDLLLRLGVGGFFLTNSVAAWIGSNEFRDIIGSHAWLTNLVNANVLIKVIGVNDGLLFLLILSGKWRKLAAIWGLAWIAGVIYMTSFAMPDTIERLAIMLLLAYYALSGSDWK
jgi:hypothetical protein